MIEVFLSIAIFVAACFAVCFAVAYGLVTLVCFVVKLVKDLIGYIEYETGDEYRDDN